MIIFLTGMPGSGKSTIVQNLIHRLTAGEELSEKAFAHSLSSGRFKSLKQPVFVTTDVPIKRVDRIEWLSNYTGLKGQTFFVHVYASPHACEQRKPGFTYDATEHHHARSECDLILDTMKSSAESNAGFLGLFVMSRKM